jgi:energy-coupling factor transporter ATP-binding protein EcfA2
MDFFQVCTKETRGGIVEVYPDFTVGRSKDLMVRGQAFYAIWDEEKGLWSTDEYDVARLVDKEVYEYAEKLKASGVTCSVKTLRSFSTNTWNQFKKFCKNVSDNSHQLDSKLTFANTETKKSDYVSRKLPYSLAAGSHDAWDELVGFLFDEEERAKIEWTIGAIVSGDSRKIEKFLVFYGPGGTGKSTIMKIMQKLFEGYIAMFEAKALVGNNNSFSTEAFKSNPLVAIQHDGDLSKIEDNSKLNSIVGHDDMLINEKYKSGYTTKINAFLLMGTNKPVKITDAKSGLIRRLIDVKPTGHTFDPDHYYSLMAKIDFELGAIAHHCLEVYRSMGKNYYNGYRPLDMMLKTDVFFNFIESHFDIFKSQDGVSLRQAFALYKEYCKDSQLEFSLPQYKFREELRNYFEEYHDRITIDGVQQRSYYTGFTAKPFKAPVVPETKPPSFSLVMDETESLLDELFAEMPAQESKADGTPKHRWSTVTTTLADLDTSLLHFVKVPENHIVIDFDLKDENGEKSLERNLEAASLWPATYAELSKSGGGVHLHYTYGGDASELAPAYSDGIEIKVYSGNSSLRRRLSKCNSVPVASINSGLPFKEKKSMLNQKTLQSEKGLRDIVARNLRKEIHPGTKPSIDFIWTVLEEAYSSGMQYDVTDLRGRIMAFANNSSNQALYCLKRVQTMKFKSDAEQPARITENNDDAPLVFFDIECYPNLFLICWKYADSDMIVPMINPTAREVEGLFQYRLVGFNNRGYDNHMMYAASMGYGVEKLYELSQKIIVEKDRGAMFGEAYNLSWADVYDFSVKKQSLKKWEIELGIHHMEMDLPWDEPAPEDRWPDIIKYCSNDVIALQETFEHCKQDLLARQIIADLSGLTVNDPTRRHVEKILFGNDRKPQEHFVYTDLSMEFPGYVFDAYSKTDKSTYRGETVGEGGYVYSEPGIYENVTLLDVASMHPTSIIELNLFGPYYTEKFKRLLDARVALKRGNYDEFVELLPGVGTPASSQDAKVLSDALKLVLNSTYGWTSATFPNTFKDIRNVDNIVAKRGALFMIELKHFIQECGYQVIHIKTDSVKIPNLDREMEAQIVEFGKKYGYDFENEATYRKLALMNDAVYIAYQQEKDPPGGFERKWTAVGTEFQRPYVFKKLFTGDPINFADLCETKSVSQGVMYLRFKEGSIRFTPDKRSEMLSEEKTDHVGRTGLFLPVVEGAGGGTLLRVKDGKEYAVAGTKGYFWMEAEMIKSLNGDALERMPFEDINEALEGTGSIADIVDLSYFEKLCEDAIKSIEKFGSFEEFVE